ncbi:MAG: hypothetical protein AAFX80_10635 [Cyanobacteria bacterium J06639_18]
MQPPIPVGTLLQNRYRIVKILGQGGFGRTYLAQDQRRFEEFCAIKELIPIAEDDKLGKRLKNCLLEKLLLYIKFTILRFHNFGSSSSRVIAYF